MCRNIRTLHHFDPPATREEVEASALQYVRKLSGMHHASRANQAAFDTAVTKVRDATLELFDLLEASGPPRSRDVEKAKAAERGKKRDEQMRERVLRTLSVSADPRASRPPRL